MDDFEKRALDASKDKSNFSDEWPVLNTNQAFVDGAKWARAEYQAENERLKLIAENYRAKFLKFIDYAEGAWGRCHIAEFFGAIREARAALDEGKK